MSNVLNYIQNHESISEVIIKTLFVLFVSFIITSCGGSNGNSSVAPCTTLDCQTLKYSLLLADVDFNQPNPQATNIQVIKTHRFQDMTHPRVSPDKLWVAYTTYNDTNAENCATVDIRVNTEIQAARLDDEQSTTIIPNTSGELTSNNYWYGNNMEFTYLAGAPEQIRLYRAQTDSSMNLIDGPTEISVPSTILPIDPHATSNNQIVYAGIYDSGGLFDVKSIFLQSLNPVSIPTALSLGRDS